jgi:Flagellar L-ring protein
MTAVLLRPSRHLLATPASRRSELCCAGITPKNTISHEKIAELRVGYGGRGQITDVQQPRYGAQALDILLPY